MATGIRITEIYAFIAIDPRDDNEGIPAISGPWQDGQEVMMPLVGADRERIISLLSLAQDLCTRSGKPMRLVRFSQMEILETLKP